MEVPFVNSESGKWTKNCTRFVTGCPKNVANFCKVTAAVAVNGLLSGGTASAPSRAAVKLGAASGQMTKQLTPTKDPFVPPPGPGKTPETVKLWASPRTAWPQRKAANRTLNACFKNPPKRRVRARGLQETMRFRHSCRPGPLTGRFSKHALRACFKNPPKRRVRARGLQETMRFRHSCRPGPLTGRFSKHALRACFKNPPRRRVRARGLHETMRFRHSCRPGPLTGRFSKHALSQAASVGRSRGPTFTPAEGFALLGR